MYNSINLHFMLAVNQNIRSYIFLMFHLSRQKWNLAENRHRMQQLFERDHFNPQCNPSFRSLRQKISAKLHL